MKLQEAKERVANTHGYKSWGELCEDCYRDTTPIQQLCAIEKYMSEAAEIYASSRNISNDVLIQQTPSASFCAGQNVFFRRNTNGSVSIIELGKGMVTFDQDTWISIIGFVSRYGPGYVSFELSKDLHGHVATLPQAQGT